MKLIHQLCALLALTCLSCSAATTSTQTDVLVVHNLALFQAYSHFDSSWNLPRPELSFENGAKAHNCEEYSKLISTQEVSESPYVRALVSQYLVCDGLAFLKSTNHQDLKVKFEGQNAKPSGQELCASLNLKSFVSSLRSQLTDHQNYLAQLAPEFVHSTKTKCVLSNQDRLFEVQNVATLLNSKGDVQKVLLAVHDQIKTGTINDTFSIRVVPSKLGFSSQ